MSQNVILFKSRVSVICQVSVCFPLCPLQECVL